MANPSRIELLELAIDVRMRDLWADASDVQDWTLEVAAAFMRAAYGKGLCDALSEENPYQLFEEFGYTSPQRRAA